MSHMPAPELSLPHKSGRLFLTDGGLETSLIFHEGWKLPMFEAFTLLEDERGRDALRRYFNRYLALSKACGVGFVLESPTWRANPDWGTKAGYDRTALARFNRAGIALMADIRSTHSSAKLPIVISGNIGPRGDGYNPDSIMSIEEAETYHSWQASVLHNAGADFISAFTMTNTNEAIGIVRAARKLNSPCVISFTLETDGKLPTGETLSHAIETVDRATDAAVSYYMINCAHPTHFTDVLEQDTAWTRRLGGIRANASKRSHAELDNATELDIGVPHELGAEYAAILRRFPQINVLGGCCGTDHRHVEAIATACMAA